MHASRPLSSASGSNSRALRAFARLIGGCCALALVFAVAGCRSLVTGGATPDAAVLVLFRADSNVRNPAVNDAYPGVRRIALRALDGATRPDDVLQLTDRVVLKPGERVLLFAAESNTGVVTLSEFTVKATAGEEFVALPVRGENGSIFVELRRGTYGEILGRSAPWKAPETRR